MIAPRGRLLWAFVLVAWPAAAAIGLLPTLAPICWLILVLFTFIILADAILWRDPIDRVSLESPELIRLANGREGAIELCVANDNSRALTLRLALEMPATFSCADEEQQHELAGTSSARLSFHCTPSKRGRYLIARAVAETPSRFGFWNRRKIFPLKSEVRVYPDLLSQRQNLAAIFLHRGNPGARAIRRVGKGRDFEQLRDYIAGDSAEDIHWKATAKRGRPVTKVFQVEQTQEVYVVIDASRLSARLAGGVPILEHFINCALILCLAAGQRNDFFGLTTFTDKVQSFVRARNGHAHYNLCRDSLYRLKPARVTPDFDDLFTFLRLRLRRRALLVFLTALDDPSLAASFTDRIDLLSRQHLVLVHGLRPPEANPIFAGSKVNDVDQIYRRLGGHIVWHDLRELGRTLHHHGVRLSLVDHASLTPDVIAQYLQVKQRQLI